MVNALLLLGLAFVIGSYLFSMRSSSVEYRPIPIEKERPRRRRMD